MGKGSAACRLGRCRGTETSNVGPGGQPCGCVAADERRGGEGKWRLATAEISVPRERPRVMLLQRSQNGRGDRRPVRHVAADKRRGREVDAAAGRPQRLALRADRRGGVSPQTSGGEGRGSKGPLSAADTPRRTAAGYVAAAAAGRPRGSAPVANGRGSVSIFLLVFSVHQFSLLSLFFQRGAF